MAGSVQRWIPQLVKSGVFITKNRVKQVLGAIATLPQQDVLVGVPGDESAREAGSPITNAALAYIHDKGAPEANIPARPFMHPGIDAARDVIAEQFRKGGKAALAGNHAGMENALHAAGLKAQASIRRVITDRIPPELAASTLAARRRRGRTGETPLIDTGQLRNSITYVLRRNTKPVVTR